MIFQIDKQKVVLDHTVNRLQLPNAYVAMLIGKGDSGLKRISILTEHLAALVPDEVARYGVYPCIEIKLAIL